MRRDGFSQSGRDLEVVFRKEPLISFCRSKRLILENDVMQLIPKPKEGEFPSYAIMYMKLVPGDGLLLKHLQDNFIAMKQLILSLPGEKLNYSYAKDKWTIKEILVHIIDDERIYAYRALRFARNDKTELPGFEQDDYVLNSNANERSIENILE